MSAGPQWLGSTGIGSAQAVETGNGSAPLTLFKTDSSFAGGVGFSGGLGVRLVASLWADTSIRYHSARLTTRFTADKEGASDAILEESIQHYQIEAGALYAPQVLQLGRATQLYASGGAGYVRQLHSGQTLAESGRTYYAGGGVVVRLPFRPGGAFKAVGVRLDARAIALTDGVTFSPGAHVAPAVAAALVVRF